MKQWSIHNASESNLWAPGPTLTVGPYEMCSLLGGKGQVALNATLVVRFGTRYNFSQRQAKYVRALSGISHGGDFGISTMLGRLLYDLC